MIENRKLLFWSPCSISRPYLVCSMLATIPYSTGDYLVFYKHYFASLAITNIR